MLVMIAAYGELELHEGYPTGGSKEQASFSFFFFGLGGGEGTGGAGEGKTKIQTVFLL